MKPKPFLKIATALLLALAAIAHADTFFVANFGVDTISQYDANGNGSSFTSAFVNGPNGVALDSSGNLYVSTNNNTIEIFAPDGTDLGVFASTGLNNADGTGLRSQWESLCGQLCRRDGGKIYARRCRHGVRGRHPTDRPRFRCKRQIICLEFWQHDRPFRA